MFSSSARLSLFDVRLPAGPSAADASVLSAACGDGPKPSAPTTSIVVFARTSSAVAPPRRSTSARASRRPSELSFPVKTTSCPASGWRPGRSGEGDSKDVRSDCVAGGIRHQDEAEYACCQSQSDMRMLLAADIGGTKTLLGLFEPSTPRPGRVASQAFGT